MLILSFGSSIFVGIEDDDSYEFLGRSETRGTNTLYRTLRIRRNILSGIDAEEPIYKVGDEVSVNGSTGR